MTAWWGVVVFVFLAMLPTVPLLVSWRRFREDGSVKSSGFLRVRVEIVLTTASFILLIAGLLWRPILGSDYSGRRFVAIYANLAVVAVVCLASLFEARRYRLPLGFASFIVALEWMYVAAVSSVV